MLELVDFAQYSEGQMLFIAWAFLTGTLFQWMMMAKIVLKFFKGLSDKINIGQNVQRITKGIFNGT